MSNGKCKSYVSHNAVLDATVEQIWRSGAIVGLKIFLQFFISFFQSKEHVIDLNLDRLKCQCNYVGHPRRNSTLKRPNSKCNFGVYFDLFWWPWQLLEMMCSASPDVAWSGLHSRPLNVASGQLFAPYHPGGCHGHQSPHSWRGCLWRLADLAGPVSASSTYPHYSSR